MRKNEVEIEVGGQALKCRFSYSPGTPDVRTLPNGDPGWVGDPSEFEVTEVEIQTPTTWLNITDLVMELGSDYIGDLVYEEAERLGLLEEEEPEPPEPDEANYDPYSGGNVGTEGERL